MIKHINTKDIIAEIDIQEMINKSLDTRESFVFESGAGSGKTYSLVSSLEHILKKEGKELELNGQKILCITYTNAAKKEMLSRINHSPLVQIRTIHDFLWEFIKPHQRVLKTIHKAKIEKTLDDLKKDTDISSTVNFFQDSNLVDLINSQLCKETHYTNYSSNVQDYSSEMRKIGVDTKLSPHSTSIGKFKMTLSSYYNMTKYSIALEKMDGAESPDIKYNSKRNYDSLERFEISHDSVLEYSNSVFRGSKQLRKVITEIFPFILIDEYQDTSELTLNIFNELLNENNSNFVIGLFGDQAQSIYSTVFHDNESITKRIKPIYKKYNRRSKTQIINVCNNIRNDGIKATSIYSNFNDGSVELRPYSTLSEIDVETITDELNSMAKNKNKDNNNNNNNNNNNKVHPSTALLMTKHSDLSAIVGFTNMYKVVSRFDVFKGSNYSRINGEFLTSDSLKLLAPLRILFNLVSYFNNIGPQTSVSSFVPKSVANTVTFSEVKKVIREVLKIKSKFDEGNESIIKFITTISELCKNDELINQIFYSVNDDDFSILNFVDSVELFLTSRSNTKKNSSIDEESDNLNDFYNLELNEIKKWVNYISSHQSQQKIIYSTMHNSKGTEYDNVILVLDDSFSRRKDFFSYFFDNFFILDKSNQKESEENLDFDQKYLEVRNLLYVSCSRAIDNLIVFLPHDMYETHKDNINQIFST